MVDSQRSTRQTKHHDREEARHEHTRSAVTRVEAVDVTVEYGTCSVSKFANLEPGDSIQHLMQTGWDQQTVNEAEDARTHRTRRDDPLAARMDSMLHWRPDVAKDRGENQTEEAGRDWHEAFATKEAEEVWYPASFLE